jgi:hypothetical protein
MDKPLLHAKRNRFAANGMSEEARTDTDVRILAARLDERLKASDMATKLAADALDAWKQSANEWRQAMNDQRSMFISRSEMISWLLIGLTILGLVMHYTK